MKLDEQRLVYTTMSKTAQQLAGRWMLPARPKLLGALQGLIEAIAGAGPAWRDERDELRGLLEVQRDELRAREQGVENLQEHKRQLEAQVAKLRLQVDSRVPMDQVSSLRWRVTELEIRLNAYEFVPYSFLQARPATTVEPTPGAFHA